MEILHTAFSIGGPLITMIGVFVSVMGTYLMTKWYHPYTGQSFVDHIVESPMLAMVLFQKKRENIPGEEPQPESAAETTAKKLLDKIERIAKLAETNKERRAVTLVGIDMVFIGFILQALGAVSSLVDVVWMHFKHVP